MNRNYIIMARYFLLTETLKDFTEEALIGVFNIMTKILILLTERVNKQGEEIYELKTNLIIAFRSIACYLIVFKYTLNYSPRLKKYFYLLQTSISYLSLDSSCMPKTLD